MKVENRPRLEWRLRVIAPKHSLAVVVNVHIVSSEGEDVRIFSQEWATGRPTKGQVDELTQAVTDDIWTTLMAYIGIQGVL